MQWHPQLDEALERARERSCPVFLVVGASWCPWTEDLCERVLVDAALAELLSSAFVCVRIDKEAEPTLDATHRLQGWPTMVVLAPGGEVLWRSGHLEPAQLARALREVLGQAAGEESEAGGTPELPRTIPGSPPPRRQRQLSMELVDDVLATLLATVDPQHGGWGTQQKFPHPEALHFATVRWSQTGDAGTLSMVLHTLRHMQEGEIYDRVEGGFYRYATQTDWSVPHYEKPLLSNAGRLLAYVEAYQALGDESFRRTAEGILGWMQATLLDPETRAYRTSQDANAEYARKRTVEEREALGAPACDERILANANAMAVCSLLKAALVLDRDELRVQALATLDFLTRELVDARVGVYHVWDGAYSLPGLLRDQGNVLRALIEAMHYAGENRYLAPAMALARGACERHQAEDGAFYDRHHLTQGTAHEGNRSLQDNAVMAEALLRLAHMTRDVELRQAARCALEAFVPTYKRYGHRTAGYGRAVDLLFHEPVHVQVVGPKGDDRTQALRAAALRPYVASRIVQTIDPDADAELFALSGLPRPREEQRARAYISQGRMSYAETSRPERLAALMTRAERSD